MNYKISVLLPSAYPEKRERFLDNLRDMSYDFNSLEICICLDGTRPDWEVDNLKYTYRKPTKYISRFFESAYRISTAPWIFLANDDILIQTRHWDRLLNLESRKPYSLLHFKDNDFNERFSCHPVVDRAVWELLDKENLVFPNFRNMGCDTTLWDVVPHALKVYLPNIEIEHMRFVDARKLNEINEDYKYYFTLSHKRDAIKKQIVELTGARDLKILIALITGEHIRRADFIPYFLGLHKPLNSVMTTIHGQSPAQARNEIVRQALAHDCSHIFFMDDDMAIPPDAITKLLAHDKDAVLGLYLMRSFPHRPVAFDQEVEAGFNKYLFMTPEVSGLIPVTNGGLGCALIKAEVFHKMEEPWFTLGELQKDAWCDDVAFFNRLRRAGFEIFLDTDLRCGHMSQVTIWPDKIGDVWHSVYKFPEGHVKFPQHIPESQEVGG